MNTGSRDNYYSGLCFYNAHLGKLMYNEQGYYLFKGRTIFNEVNDYHCEGAD